MFERDIILRFVALRVRCKFGVSEFMRCVSVPRVVRSLICWVLDMRCGVSESWRVADVAQFV